MDEWEWDWKEAVVAVEVLSWLVSEGTDDNHEISQGSRCADLDRREMR
jgi:hypothetical protein